MQIHHIALLLLTLSTRNADARRVQKKRAADQSSLQVQGAIEGGKTCHITESSYSLKYGIKGSWKVKKCMFCTFHGFLTEAWRSKLVTGAEPSDDDKYCKCYTSPRFWEAKGLDKKFWFQFLKKSRPSCSQSTCLEVFEIWANMFNRKVWEKKENKTSGDFMPPDLLIDDQKGYVLPLHCDDARPEGLHLPSPSSKILELRLKIEECTDPDEKLILEEMQKELLNDPRNAVEIFAYALDEDWSPIEHEVDASADGEYHTFFLKPCKSEQHGTEVTELKEIKELCGQPELGISMKGGRMRVSYAVTDPWGNETACEPAEEACQLVRSIAADEGVDGEILSFRLRPCKSPSGKKIEELNEIFKVKSCGPPSTKKDSHGLAKLLPVLMDMSSKYDEAELSTDDVLEFPCADKS